MNARIRELIEAASGDDWRGDKLNPVMLVELVVKECVGVADTYIQTGEHARPTSRSTIGRLIKQHFGVKL